MTDYASQISPHFIEKLQQLIYQGANQSLEVIAKNKINCGKKNLNEIAMKGKKVIAVTKNYFRN